MAPALSTHTVNVEIPLVTEGGTEVSIARKKWTIEVDHARWEGSSLGLNLPFVVTHRGRRYEAVALLGHPRDLPAVSTYRHSAITLRPSRIEELEATNGSGSIQRLSKAVY